MDVGDVHADTRVGSRVRRDQGQLVYFRDWILGGETDFGFKQICLFAFYKNKVYFAVIYKENIESLFHIILLTNKLDSKITAKI